MQTQPPRLFQPRTTRVGLTTGDDMSAVHQPQLALWQSRDTGQGVPGQGPGATCYV